MKRRFKKQILKQKFHNVSDFNLEKGDASDFKLKTIQRVRFGIENFSTCQTLKKKVCIQKFTFWFFLLRKNDIYGIFCAFLKSISLI